MPARVAQRRDQLRRFTGPDRWHRQTCARHQAGKRHACPARSGVLPNRYEDTGNHSDLLYSRLTHRRAGFFLFTTKTKLQPAKGTARTTLGF